MQDWGMTLGNIVV